MLNKSEISSASTSRTHRVYSAQFKAELVEACHQPGAAIAAVARQHAMNANVLHRWLKEHQGSGRHEQVAHDSAAGLQTPSTLAAFLPLQLPPATPQPDPLPIKAELRRGPLSMVVTWPVNAVAEFASWTAAVFK